MREETRTVYISESGTSFSTALEALERDAEDACEEFFDSELRTPELGKVAISRLALWHSAKTAKENAF